MSIRAPGIDMSATPTRQALRCGGALTRMPATLSRAGSPMTPSFSQIRRLLAGTVLACALAACATIPPPTSELNGAQQAVMRATGADADQYAREQIELARQALARAQAAMAQGDNDNARAFALAAEADADLAHAMSREALASTQVAQRRSEIQRLRNQLQTEARR